MTRDERLERLERAYSLIEQRQVELHERLNMLAEHQAELNVRTRFLMNIGRVRKLTGIVDPTSGRPVVAEECSTWDRYNNGGQEQTLAMLEAEMAAKIEAAKKLQAEEEFDAHAREVAAREADPDAEVEPDADATPGADTPTQPDDAGGADAPAESVGGPIYRRLLRRIH